MKVNMKTSDLKIIFDACKNFVTTTSERRPFLEKIQLVFKNKICTAYACDSVKVITLTVPCEVEEWGEGVIITPIIKLPKVKEVMIYDDGDEIIFDFLTEKQIIKKETEWVNDIEKFLQHDTCNLVIGFDPIHLSKAFNSFKDDEFVKLHFTDSTHVCYIEGTNKKATIQPFKFRSGYKCFSEDMS